jgi:hypothetical protein
MNSKDQEIEKRRILDPLIDKVFGSSRSSGTKNVSKRTEALASRISNDLTSIVKMTSRIQTAIQRNQESILTKPVVGLDTSKAVKILDNMLSFMQKSREQDTQDFDTQRSFNEMNEYAAADRHKEIIDVFIQATKKKRQVQNNMAREAKSRKGAKSIAGVIAGVIAAGVAGAAAVAGAGVAGAAAVAAAIALASKIEASALDDDELPTGTVNPNAGELGNRDPDYRMPAPAKAVPTPTDSTYEIVVDPDPGPKPKPGRVKPPDNQDGATAPPPKGKDGLYPFVTSGPNKGKRWSPTTPGPTIPGGVATPAPIKTTKIVVDPDPGPKPKPGLVRRTDNQDNATATPAPKTIPRIEIRGVGRGPEEAPTSTDETVLYIDQIKKELSLPIPEELKVGGKWTYENLVQEQKEAIDNIFIANGLAALERPAWNEVLLKRSPAIQKKVFDAVNEEVKLERKNKLEDVNAFKEGNPIPGLIKQRNIKLKQLERRLETLKILDEQDQRIEIAKGEELGRLSIESKDIKKKLSQSSSSPTVIVNQENITKKQKTVVVNPQRKEELNPTMRR